MQRPSRSPSRSGTDSCSDIRPAAPLCLGEASSWALLAFHAALVMLWLDQEPSMGSPARLGYFLMISTCQRSKLVANRGMCLI